MKPSDPRGLPTFSPVWPVIALIFGFAPAVCAAREQLESFDDERPSWTVVLDQSAVRVSRHVRTTELRHEGRAAELLDVEVAKPIAGLDLVHELPPARVIDELRLSLWFHSNQDGATLAVRVVFPNQVDPLTGENLTVPISGDAYTKPGHWQKLECQRLSQKLHSLLPQLRRKFQVEAGFKGDLDTSGAYIDAAIVNIQTSRGQSQFAVDEMRLGPIVEAARAKTIRQAAQTERGSEPEPEAKLNHLAQLFVRGRPFFPRIIPYHQEQPGELARMGFNVVWVPDYRETVLLEELGRVGLRGMAIPPRADAAADNHLAPFGSETAPILFWYLGTRIGADKKRALADWQEQISNADHRFKRPVTGDVIALERTYSRLLSMLSVSRPAVQTGFGLRSYRDWLIERRNLAQPGSFVWTWIQTEPVLALDEMRQAAGWSPQVVEPEQLRLQVYMALSAGCRGLGFWTHSSLDDERPGALERKLMLTLLNFELELLEPLLASGSLSGQTTFAVQQPPMRNLTQAANPALPGAGKRQKELLLNDRDLELRKRDQMKRDLEAAVIGVPDVGILVLPVFYADDAQYVPGPMAANDARIVIPGAGEAARAWELTTTEIERLEHERVAGGRQVKLRKFDMTAAILCTEDEALVERFRAKVKTLREPAARISVELARVKYERVAAVDLELKRLGLGQPDAARILTSARTLIEQADAKFRTQRFHEARTDAADAMQLLRILQHTYWNDATSRLYSPVSSPHTLCFQTLPDHWKMVGRIGRTRTEDVKNVLRSGDFEDRDTMVAEGWQHDQTTIDGVRSTAELYRRPHKGTYALRLIATPAPGEDPPASIPERPVTVTSPPVTVYKGQLVYIDGWVKVDAPSLGNLDGALLYDSLAGPTAALRWRTTTDGWKQFEIVREVHETCELTVTMALSGLGEIRFDDLRIIPLDVDPNFSPAGKKAGSRPTASSPLDFLRRLPGFGGKSDSK